MSSSLRPLLVCLAVAACREIPSPDGNVLSISALEIPSPGLVVDDSLRDENGNPVALSVTAYDAAGNALDPQPPVSFVVIDDGAHMEGPYLVGDEAGETVRVVGTVGSLQTQPVSVKVTLAPQTISAADSVLHRVRYTGPSSTDTVATSAQLSVLVQNTASTAPVGVETRLVDFAITRAPAETGLGPTAVLLNGTRLSTRDTTDTGGRASRQVRLRLNALTSFTTDTVEVTATTSYRGASLGTVVFTIIFTKQ